MGNKSIYERKASSVLGQIDGIGRKAHRFWLAACWGYCLVVFMSGDSQNNALASTSPSPLQHPMAILTRRFFPPESRERRMARRAAAEQERIYETDLSNPHIHVWVVTTASLPWMTGTSINPLLRAAFLVRGRDANMVTLMIPFLSPEDQRKVFPPNLVFNTAEEQEVWVRNWLEEAGLGREASRLRMMFYPGRYHRDYGSIFPMGDLTIRIPSEEADVCILEEPEHLNWYRAPGRSWRRAFKHVVGIVHTNYLAYASTYTLWGPLLTFMLRYMNIIMARAYCHKIIKLSSVIQSLAPEKETVCNVHGVRETFLKVGDEYSHKSHTAGAYFIGKSLWAKGYDRLIKLLGYSHDRLGRSFHLDVYGSGPDREAIEDSATDNGCDLTFFPATDHALLGKYSVFVNPSVTEVLCTTVAEALAMGKWVVCSRHPSNEFFFQFPNCLPFTTEEDFAACLSWALRHDPEELSPDLRYKLTWAAATERLLEAAVMTVGERNRQKTVADGILAIAHAVVGSGPSGDFIRLLAGGDSAAWQHRYIHEQRMQEREMNRAALGNVEEGTVDTTDTTTTIPTGTTSSTLSNSSPSGLAIGTAAGGASVATSL